jgi:hypothetical protein
MAPKAPWSSDRAPEFHSTPMMILKKYRYPADKEIA